MTPLSSLLESLLFVATKPMTVRTLASAASASTDDVAKAVAELMLARNIEASGIHVVQGEEGVMLVTNPAFAESLSGLAKEEIDAELTRPSLETLTIVAYRGPITKPEIEAIRGVNCTLILRNLLMRGLIVEDEDVVKMQSVYSLSDDALRYLGLHDVTELLDYELLRGNAKITTLLETTSSPMEV